MRYWKNNKIFKFLESSSPYFNKNIILWNYFLRIITISPEMTLFHIYSFHIVLMSRNSWGIIQKSIVKKKVTEKFIASCKMMNVSYNFFAVKIFWKMFQPVLSQIQCEASIGKWQRKNGKNWKKVTLQNSGIEIKFCTRKKIINPIPNFCLYFVWMTKNLNSSLLKWFKITLGEDVFKRTFFGEIVERREFL